MGSLVIADGDVVEPKNLGRQNFVQSDIGEFKSVALARRYSGAFGIPIRAIRGFLDDIVGLRKHTPQLVVGCVDRHAARRTIAEYMSHAYECAWIDSGNETVAGQVVLGYTGPQYRAGSTRASGPIPVALPTISQMLELPITPEARPGCADMLVAPEQTSTVNIVAGAQIANMVRLILEDVKRQLVREPVKGISFGFVYFNVETGGMTTKYNSADYLALARKPMAPWLR